MFDTINRDALIVYPKQALIDWVNTVFPEDPMECPKMFEHDEGTIYLIPEFDHYDHALDFLKKNFKYFFDSELFGWCTDEEAWPQKRTWKMFQEFFHFSIQSVVINTVEGSIEEKTFPDE